MPQTNRSMNTPYQGGCLCGSFRYEVTGEPLSSSICHCRSCRLASGAPSVGWLVVERHHFRVLSGRLTTFRSSTPVLRGFCQRCGTPLTYEHDDSPSRIEFTTATLDRPEAHPPSREIWLSEKIAWMSTDPHRDAFSRDSDGPVEPVGR
jgi:hypothetical protein